MTVLLALHLNSSQLIDHLKTETLDSPYLTLANGASSLESSTIMNPDTSLDVRSCPDEDGDRMQKVLSEDDILEILARLPVKSLLRFKSVSKLWYSLISSPNFIALHYAHSHRKKKVSLLVYSCKNNIVAPPNRNTVARPPKTTVSFGFGDITQRLTFWDHLELVEIVGCFNGVVCLSLSERPQKYALWNPATRQVREIGDAMMEGPASTDMDFVRNGSWYGSGFCFDPIANAFKVAQFRLTVTEEEEIRAQVNVFCTATSSWTEKNIPVTSRIRLTSSNIIRGATCVNGYMHWLVSIIHSSRFRSGNELGVSFEIQDMYILSYDMVGEVFKRIEMPITPVFLSYHIAGYRGSLAVFVDQLTGSSSSYDEFDVWVLNDCGSANPSWSKVLTCRPSIMVSFFVGFFRKDNLDLILFRKKPDNSLYLYDPKSGETKEFGKRDSGKHTFIYSESLASLNQRRQCRMEEE